MTRLQQTLQDAAEAADEERPEIGPLLWNLVSLVPLLTRVEAMQVDLLSRLEPDGGE
ncbi:MAG: hypothetical protein ACRD22_19455 [Terriglobia bacterium]